MKVLALREAIVGVNGGQWWMSMKLEPKGGAELIAWMDRCISGSEPCDAGGSPDSKFGKAVPNNGSGLLATMRSEGR